MATAVLSPGPAVYRANRAAAVRAGQGPLVESGRHEDLVTAGGRYAELYGLQATAYAPT